MHPNKWLLWAAGVLLILATVAVTWLRAATVHTVGTLTTNPAYVVVNTPTSVLFTITITDPAVLPTGVNLLQTDANGTTISTVGVMHDDGANGDLTAGDKVFSYEFSINQPSVGDVYYRVSAAFKGVLQRVQSPVLPVSIWQRFVDASSRSTVVVPPFGADNTRFEDKPLGPNRNVLTLSILLPNEAEYTSMFAISIEPNTADSLTDWFSNDVDHANILLGSSTYTTVTLEDGRNALVRSGPVPATFAAFGTELAEAYILSENGSRVASITKSQESPLSRLGYSDESTSQLLLTILGNVAF